MAEDEALTAAPGDHARALSEDRAREHHLPDPRSTRRGIALCLSGGGYRAMLFHLGALRRLNEVGLLSNVTTISSVSGGSIMSGLLADRIPQWPAPGTVLSDWDATVAEPARRFTRRNIRTPALVKSLMPWTWLQRSTAVRALARAYEKHLTKQRLAAIPERPDYVFCATDLGFGANWEFRRHRMGDYLAGYMKPPPTWAVAHAVAASSCFPPVFNPLPLDRSITTALRGGSAPSTQRDAVLRDLRLTDGGVYDNLGLEPVWKDHALVLSSDGGSPFPFSDDRGLLSRLQRYVAVQGNQSGSVRKRWLIASFLEGRMDGTYWGIATDVKHYAKTAEGYTGALAEELIARIRTDLDAFSDGEQAVLENHGYLVCAAALDRHLSAYVRKTPVVVPHSEWMDEVRVRRQLWDSGRRKILGRR